ncbi:MAG: hypothetical protein AMXMBFR36_15710 [Acidobacteriota bacterium]
MFVDPVSPYFKRSAYWLAVGVWVALMLAAIIANGGTGEFTSPRAFLFVALAFLSMSSIAAITLFSRQARSALLEPETDWSKARPNLIAIFLGCGVIGALILATEGHW